ncbi:hypothetical protein BH18THE2_BH18THE2_06900 [soil metagenome]
MTSPTNEVSETGSMTADKLECPMDSKHLADLATAKCNGEIRGQISCRCSAMVTGWEQYRLI